MLREVGCLCTPDTILRWHRELVAKKWDYSNRRKQHGRPPIERETVNQILQLAKDNQQKISLHTLRDTNWL